MQMILVHLRLESEILVEVDSIAALEDNRVTLHKTEIDRRVVGVSDTSYHDDVCLSSGAWDGILGFDVHALEEEVVGAFVRRGSLDPAWDGDAQSARLCPVVVDTFRGLVIRMVVRGAWGRRDGDVRHLATVTTVLEAEPFKL